MINYPNGTVKKTSAIRTNDGNKNRGMDFEAEINMTNEAYRNQDKAVIYKKPTPIKVVKITNTTLKPGKITEAYYEKPSTTDYNGIYKGRYIDFEAKETLNKTSFPLSNIHAHQIDHLVSVKKHGGIAFIIVCFKRLNEVYILDIDEVIKYKLPGERKSIPHEVFVTKGKLVPQGFVLRIDYLSAVDKYYKL